MRIFISILMILLHSNLDAQKYYAKDAQITFSSKAPLETIEAINNKALTVMDLDANKIEWSVLIKGFQFEKALMEEHFNENYLESSKYPKALFKGKLQDDTVLRNLTEGVFEILYSGDLTIHNVTRPVSGTATFTIVSGSISVAEELSILCEDYDIDIPKLVRDNIAKQVDIQLSANYLPYSK